MKNKVSVGDKIKVKKGDAEYEGILLPTTDASNKDILILKLSSGYNIGIKKDKNIKIDLIKKSVLKPGRIPKIRFKKNPELPNVTIIGTGGTIGTHVDYKTGGVFMCRTPEEILATVPEIGNIININKVINLFSIASEDINVNHWKKIAGVIKKEVENGVDAIIITHGTDTLALTSAVLNFMIGVPPIPIALVGAQRSPDRGSFDGRLNLLCAAHYCTTDIAEVSVVMHGSINDDFCYAIKGTKVRKNHSSRRDAFQPVNTMPFVKLWEDGKKEFLRKDYHKREKEKRRIDLKLNYAKVGLLKVYPNSDPKILEWYYKKGYEGLVIEGTGLGHVPGKDAGLKNNWLPIIKKLVNKGVIIVICTSTINGRTNNRVYRNLRLLNKTGVLWGKDLHAESALVKLGVVLGNAKNLEHAKKMFKTNLVGEFEEKNIVGDNLGF